MKTILFETYYGHQIEVTIIETSTGIAPSFIPDSVKECILNQLCENATGGTFQHDECKDCVSREENIYTSYQGTWRMLELNAQLLHRVVMWQSNHYSDEALSENLFIKYYGVNDGKHFFSKWIYTYKKDTLDMITYFGKYNGHAQTFCNMLMEQVEMYETNRNKQ